ncbi:hypothetical protein MNEG_10323 [Monoraphidium neglectum]|uniref:Uncharacterized protein n=1 Tax=Monoraphidium neglectum TaxID=145388 RepID=A0A0D2KPY3_9CHLO|nr:hypothetical protein MNEG_10323 [Monoraphidium neglectum]KIY97638.1 hypothetical protein MNEG_10323 [Monoraphidium neglectum]|eukprot:XP_013896658.1 hypothetical protein MNEG_10323 [Monoraphidium neglectum]
MDADFASDQVQQQQPQQHDTALTKQMNVQHLCDHRCSVQHMFGNAFRCQSSGQLHVCDANCTQRVYNDRYSTICRISRKVFANAWAAPAPCRKRSCSFSEEAPADACRKRGPGAPAACPDVPGFYAAGPGSQGDAMVM